MNIRVSIVIVSYHNEKTILSCLDSIKRHVSSAYEVIQVDNSNDDLTAEKVTEFIENNPGFLITLLKPKRNLGFAAGCNLGATQATGDYLMFLNPDTCLKNDVATLLIDFLERTEGALIAGPMIIDPNGRITRTCRNLPNWRRILLDATGIDRLVGKYSLIKFSHNRPRMVEQLIGACFLLKRTTFEGIGRLDKRFFMYFEEVDLCKRILDEGGEIWFRPEAQIMHIAGVSTESNAAVSKMIQTLRHSRRLYFEKHLSRSQQVLLACINRFEGLYRGGLFSFLFLCSRRELHFQKARGYFRLLLC